MQPLQSAELFMYVGDSARLSKFRSDGTRYNWGIIPPSTPPSLALNQPLYQVVDPFASGESWTAAGTAGSATLGGARVPGGTTVAHIAYDSGVTGWASINFSSTSNDWLQPGALLQIASEIDIVVQEVIPPALSTTTLIAGIQYDSGTTGPCCIVVASSTAAIQERALVLLNAELIIVQSVAIGEDGSVSFRTSTAGAHAIGETVTFYLTARCYTVSGHAAADAVLSNEMSWQVTAGTGTQTMGSMALDISQIQGRQTTDQDYMHVSINVDNLANITQVVILLDVDSATNDFTKNYYYADITQNYFNGAAAGSGVNNLSAQIQAIQAAAIQDFAAAMAQPGTPIGAINPTSSQLYTGASQWSEVLIKLNGLTRVGTDLSRTLANVAAIQIQVTCTGTVNMQASSWWVGGTYGPDAPVSINPESPIKYQFRYRSTITGAISVGSPVSRNGQFPQRQGMIVGVAYSTDPQVDQVDIARVGGSIDGAPLYIGSIPNNTAGGTGFFFDNYNDDAASDPFETDTLPPWPIEQQPVTGTCSVVGTTVYATSNNLPGNLAPGTLVIVNGIATTVYGQPNGQTFQVTDNLGNFSSVNFQVEAPTVFGQALPYMAGPYGGMIIAAGDGMNPDRIYFTTPENPDGCATSNFLVPDGGAGQLLLAVGLYNGYVFAASGERFFAGRTATGGSSALQFTEANVGQGLLQPWAYAVGPLIFFLSRNGILATDLGPAQSLTEQDLYLFLPHEGGDGENVYDYVTPSLGNPGRLRLSYCKNGWLYFDYQGIDGNNYTMAFNTLEPGWLFDSYQPQVILHYQEEVEGSLNIFCGCVDGTTQLFNPGVFADTGGPISCHVRGKAYDYSDLRALKLFGDYMLDCDASNAASPGITATLLGNFYTDTLASGIYTGFRERFPIDVNEGEGTLDTNAALDITWEGQGTVYQYDISAVPKAPTTRLRTTDWIDLGKSVWLQGLRVTANTFGSTLPVLVEYDGGEPLGLSIGPVLMTHDGEIQIPYSFQPVFAHRIRLTPQDASLEWYVLGVEPVGAPAPEATTNWQPQPTSHGLRGYQHAREMRLPVIGAAGTQGTLLIGTEFPGSPVSVEVEYTGAFQKLYIPLPPNKGMLFQYSLIGAAARVFERDLEVSVKEWGSAGPFQTVRPFGDDSGGARI